MLRPYQREVYLGTYEALKAGHKGILIVLPCRSGKSFVMKELIEHIKGECLVLAHRRELIKQHKELLKDCENARVESVFTEVRHLGEHKTPAIVFIDEAHLSGADSYRTVCEYYGRPVIGFTATPTRLDGRKLELFEVMVTSSMTANILMLEGNISLYDYYGIDVGLDLTDTRTIGGEYVISDLEELLSKSAIYGDVVNTYKQLANNKQAIAYCVSVNHANMLAEQFNASGVSAISMSAKTPTKEREQYMADFKSGKFKVLCNVGLISEGITVPDCECCLLVRPTASLALYIQQSMRCLTPKPDKKAIIIDFVGNFQRHGLPTQDREWTLDGVKTPHKEFNEHGEFTIRQCPECFKVFKTANECPYCHAMVEVKPREIKKMAEINMRKVTEEEAKRIEAMHKEMRREVGRAKTYADLVKIQQARGYKPQWVGIQMKLKGIKRYG